MWFHTNVFHILLRRVDRTVVKDYGNHSAPRIILIYHVKPSYEFSTSMTLLHQWYNMPSVKIDTGHQEKFSMPLTVMIPGNIQMILIMRLVRIYVPYGLYARPVIICKNCSQAVFTTLFQYLYISVYVKDLCFLPLSFRFSLFHVIPDLIRPDNDLCQYIGNGSV